MSLIVVMVISFHQIVDDAVGVFMSLCGQVEIDHGGVQAAMSQILLDTTDIDTGLQQMGGVAVSQGMDRDFLFEFELRQNPAQGTLNGLLVHRGFSRRAFFGTSSQAREYPESVAVELPVIS